MIDGTVAIVQTLLICVGALKSPCTGGNGGRGRGWPRRPSSESSSAVSSPQMYAPAPRYTVISTSPKSPASRASSTARSRISYSARYSPRM